jgi:hypothetical protein
MFARTVLARVACDEEYRTRHQDWRADAAECVHRASAPYEEDLGVRLVPEDFVAWTSDNRAVTMAELRDQLARDVSADGVDVVIGLCGQHCAAGGTGLYEAYGLARSFEPHLTVAADWPRESGPHQVKTVAHEIAHAFGAWHCADPGSIMATGSSAVGHFDLVARAVLSMTLGLDHRRGLESITVDARKEIDVLWRRGHVKGDVHPVAIAYINRANGARYPRPRDAIADFTSALAVLDGCGDSDSEAYANCLLAISHAYSLVRPPDASMELAFAVRGRELLDALGRPEENPVAVSSAQLGHAYASNGRYDDAVRLFLEAFEVRRRRLGYGHALTCEARDAIKRLAEYGSRAAARALAQMARDA